MQSHGEQMGGNLLSPRELADDVESEQLEIGDAVGEEFGR